MSVPTSNDHNLTSTHEQKDISDIKFLSLNNCQHTDQSQTQKKILSGTTNIQPPNYSSSEVPTYASSLATQELKDLSLVTQGIPIGNNITDQTNSKMELDDAPMMSNNTIDIQSFHCINPSTSELIDESQPLKQLQQPLAPVVCVDSNKQVSHQEEFRFQSVRYFFSDLCFRKKCRVQST